MKKLLNVLIVLAFLTLPLEAKKVKGSVKCGEKALAGVVVSDGYRFTTTLADGSHRLFICRKKS